MEVTIKRDPLELGQFAGQLAAEQIRTAIDENGQANILLATGASQLETLNRLVKANEVDWTKVVMFHLDEYIGMSASHPASFSRYLKERFLDKVGPIKAGYLIDGMEEPGKECERLNKLIVQYPIDVALVGIGENGHLAFNDPPADFDTRIPYLVVQLDHRCRQQQLAEGWFDALADVPAQAISMSVQQILAARYIICSVPGERKALAVQQCLENPVSNQYPASILQGHQHCSCFLDSSSAQLLQSVLR